LLNNKFKLNLNFLTNMCHNKYSKCPPVDRMQTWRRLRRCTINNAAFYSSLRINQTLHLFTSCTCVW